MKTLLFAIVLVIIIAGASVLPLQVLKAQNMTIKMYNATSADQVNSSVIANLVKHRYGNKYDVVVNQSTISDFMT